MLTAYQGVTMVFMLLFRVMLVKFNVGFTSDPFILLSNISRRNFLVLKMSILTAARIRLHLINNVLLENQSNSMDILKTFFVLHNKFGDAVNLINKCLSFNLLMNLFEFGLHLVMLSFNIYKFDMNYSTIKGRILFLMSFTFFICEGVYIMLIHINSNFLKEGATRSIILLNKKISTLDNFSEILRFSQIASLQIDHQTPAITFGLFVFDWKLFFAIISCSFCYVIILVQFDVAGYS